MKNKKIFTSTVLAILLVCSVLMPLALADVMYEQSSTVGGSSYNIRLYTTNWAAQNFTASSNHTIDYVKLDMFYEGTNQGNLTIGIRATSGGLPTGNDLVNMTTNATLSSMSTSASWIEFDFASSLNVTNGTSYALVVRSSGGSNGNDYGWHAHQYSGNSFLTSSDSGSTWGATNGFNFDYQTYAGSPKYQNVTSNSTTPFTNCTLSTLWNAPWTDENVSGLIFGTDVSGTFTNDTWTPFSSFYNSTAAWSNKTVILPNANSFHWQVWANDSRGFWTSISLQTITLPLSNLNNPVYSGFGYSLESQLSFSTVDTIMGTNFTLMDTAHTTVTASSMSMYLGYSPPLSKKIIFGLFNSNLGYIASTQSYWDFYTPYWHGVFQNFGWLTLNFTTSVTLTNNTSYWLVAWAGWTAQKYQYYPYSPYSSKSFNMTGQTYNGTFPTQLTPSTYQSSQFDIYLNYSTTYSQSNERSLLTTDPQNYAASHITGVGLRAATPSTTGNSSAAGETVMLSSGNMNLTKVAFMFGTSLSATPINGTDAHVDVYATSGTYGSTAVPTGSPLATSQNFDLMNVPFSTSADTYYWHQPWWIFYFNGTFQMQNGTAYAIVFKMPTNTNVTSSNYIAVVAVDLDVYSGNFFRYNNGGWDTTYGSSYDYVMAVWGVYSISSVDLEPSGNTLVTVSSSITFTATATGGTQPYIYYQWFQNGVFVPVATSSTYQFVPPALGNFTIYSLVSDVNWVTTQSNTATVSVVQNTAPPPVNNQTQPQPTEITITIVVINQTMPTPYIQISLISRVAITDFTGSASFYLTQGTYPITLSLHGEVVYSGQIRADYSGQVIMIDVSPAPAPQVITLTNVSLGLITITVIISLAIVSSQLTKKDDKKFWRNLMKPAKNPTKKRRM